MRYTNNFAELPMACPRCETELDQASGICPACRWERSFDDPREVAQTTEPVSYSERYRGTRYEGEMAYGASTVDSTGRTRALLVVGLVGVSGLFYFVAHSIYLV